MADEEESKLVVEPAITMEEFRAHIDACLDLMEMRALPTAKCTLSEWHETLDAASAEEE